MGNVMNRAQAKAQLLMHKREIARIRSRHVKRVLR